MEYGYNISDGDSDIYFHWIVLKLIVNNLTIRYTERNKKYASEKHN